MEYGNIYLTSVLELLRCPRQFGTISVLTWLGGKLQRQSKRTPAAHSGGALCTAISVLDSAPSNAAATATRRRYLAAPIRRGTSILIEPAGGSRTVGGLVYRFGRVCFATRSIWRKTTTVGAEQELPKQEHASSGSAMPEHAFHSLCPPQMAAIAMGFGMA